MIPILFEKNAVDFSTNGLGRLIDCVSCKVTEERNGIYELEFVYPITGRFYQTMIDDGGTVCVWHNDQHDIQAFDIYAHSDPMDGQATFYAHHISYRLNRIIVEPFSAASPAEAITKLRTKSVNDNPFTFWTNKSGTSEFNLTHPSDIRSLLFGQEGSILDTYGKGEYEFDMFNVKLYVNRGINTDVTIRYGKNLSDIKKEYDESDIFTAIAPYWIGSEGQVIFPPEIIVASQNIPISLGIIPVPKDFSDSFEEEPTVEQLREKAISFIDNNEKWAPDENVTVNFVALWQTPEYENVAPLQRLSLCDTVSIFYPELGIISENQKVIKVVYDVLLERYSEMELGERQASYAETITNGMVTESALKSSLNRASNLIQEILEGEVQHATELITGGLGGYVVIKLNANEQPEEFLIMDTPDINTAVNVWRWNKNGLGHSHRGYNGPFSDVAITQDGRINANLITTGVLNADLITTGTMLANRILGGTLKLGGDGNGNGVLEVYNADGTKIGTFDNNGVSILEGIILGASIYSQVLDRLGNHNKEALAVSMVNGKLNFLAGGTSLIKPSTISRFKTIHYITPGIIAEADSHINYYNAMKFVSLKYRDGTATSGFEWYLQALDDDSVLKRVMFLNKAIYGSNEWYRLALHGAIILDGNTQKTSGIVWAARNAAWDTSYVQTGPYEGYGIKAYLNPNTSSSISVLGTEIVGALNVTGTTSLQNSLTVTGPLTATGTKSRAVNTDQYGERLLYCYETPSPLFGDIGEGQIAEDGVCFVWLDPVLAQTITTGNYQVFLQKYGEGDAYVSERKPGYFVVKGTPGLAFGWELKAKQADFDQKRLDKTDSFEMEPQVDYGAEAASYIIELEKGRLSA